jgi:hypothetical protein
MSNKVSPYKIKKLEKETFFLASARRNTSLLLLFKTLQKYVKVRRDKFIEAWKRIHCVPLTY